jgi:glycosyltransferase involved in cell wall biosynthesis
MKLSIIIPARNEEKRIGETLLTYSSYFEKLRIDGKLDYNMLVVINNTQDKTEEVVKSAGLKNKRINFLTFSRGGKGFAILEGFKHSLKSEDFSFIGFVDSDMATRPEDFYDLVKNIGKFDIVIASRWMDGSIIKIPQSPLRKITSWGFNFLVRGILLLPYSDTQCGAKLFNRKAIKEIISQSISTEWAFDIDILYKLRSKNFKIKEIPTVWEDKKGSVLNLFKTPLKMFSSIIRLRFVHSPFRFIVDAYDRLPDKIKIHRF